MSDLLDGLDLSGVLTSELSASRCGKSNGSYPCDKPIGHAGPCNCGPAPDKPSQAPRPEVYRRGGNQPLIFDLETVPDESRMAQFGLDPLPSPRTFTQSSILGIPDKLAEMTLADAKKMLEGLWPPAEWIAAAESRELKAEKPRKGLLDELRGLAKLQAGEADSIKAAVDAQRKTMSVTPEFCKIVAMGFCRGPGEIITHVVGQDFLGFAATEKTILEKFWDLVECSPLVGFNVVNFDLPVIFVRSAILGVKPSQKIDMRPWGGQVIDLMTARWPKGGQKGLKDLARILGFTVPAEGMDGSQVYDLWKAGDLDSIAKYQASDIDVTRRLYEFMFGYWF